ncbi:MULTISPECIES: amidase [Bradyrhizobium]|uniref:Amidase n=1 Tax=Bradyrhizobium ottawaense TaxID=931866 RepID=A0ABV4G659_9BRAD|nr:MULTISPECIES: amidase [Bradyrhizobium]MBR1290113.1 amidase [Bradyrhizobium ottawaense]WLB49329.1 amidase [Bradyrhizobium ottawaense]WQN79367.1 amidase [Bradyrhizobium ottawaense]BBO05631.1 amidase [Bradyrhizobium ottawaense]GMO35695.1 amidase [Bradyrhizobium ottawaense]
MEFADAADLNYGSIRALASALRARRISASELLEHTIARIEALDGRINAVIVRDFDRARAAARAADAALGRGEQRPLLGIPVTLKEPFNVAGLPTNWGFPHFRDFQPAEDALVVSRLKAAGAVVIGKTNIPIGLRDFQSYNEIYGTTNNPWDLGRSPGGSSGGSGAALAAGFGPLSIGSDIGGSIRVPSHFCGVFGHKPSLGLVPLRGYSLPPAPPVPGQGDLAVVGPMARTASDLALALDVIAGPDETRDGVGYRLALPAPRHDRLRDFRILVVDTHPLMPTGDAVRSAIGRLAERLGRSGAQVARSSTSLPDLAESARLYMRLLNAARSPRLTPAAIEEARGLAAALAPDDRSLQAERARGWGMIHREWLATDAARLQLQQRWEELFREFDAVIYPAAAVPAFPHDHSEPFDARQLDIDGRLYNYSDACFIWADPASTCGLPATAVPIERTSSGLPVGAQIIGPYLEDRTTMALAGLIEREFGGFVPPPALSA